jgi:Putative auto-transporter adhesin, head GIN domain
MKIVKSALVLALVCLVAGCSSDATTQGSGNIKTESRSVSDFTGVEVSGNAKLVVEQGDREDLAITADDNLLQYLTSDVEKSKLMLATKGLVSLQPTAPITYTLTVKHLNVLGVSGSVIVDARGIRTDSLTVAISGSGDITISGEADAQKIAVSGTADYKAESFNTKDTSISISGSGKAVVAASNLLDVQVSGSGDVKYIGSPKVTKGISGAGTVEAWKP